MHMTKLVRVPEKVMLEPTEQGLFRVGAGYVNLIGKARGLS